VQTYQTFNELHNTSLPIQRELVNIKLDLAFLLTEILDTHVNEIKEKNVKNLHKDHVIKVGFLSHTINDHNHFHFSRLLKTMLK
jgi:hypothetical protein